METTTKSSATNYGLYLGGVLALATILVYALKLELFASITLGIILFVITLTFGVISIIKSKKIQNGFISFKEAFTSYFITVLIGIVISSLISFIIFNFVDPEAAETLKEIALESQVEMLRNFNQPEESIEMVVEASEKQGNLFSIQNVFTSLIGYIIFYSIIGLIISLIMKRKPENA
ncbi:DUF4199 domain-containing protein [Lacinutrix venerupis]|uniref:DUF4199 domain-containing protein n=1 Tax=Lacinutrix venerupis TaxID=1486034 RepID=A0AAC9LN08_9FLAO|nr:DUF4199 domain-containing protein [Lacinutrix venerupis]APY01474.1 DUF4199 domain-containing protein [Lacinutrix venerupis]